MTRETLTWRTLIELEPRLTALYRRAKAVRDQHGPSFCANAVWYGHLGLKNQLVMLVGWEGPTDGNKQLRTEEAYNLAYQKIYDPLPSC
jgi:hypothetical protein